jgi:hypothetical protein
VIGALPPLRTCLANSLLQLPLRAYRSLQLRFGPADRVAKVARKANEARPPASLDVQFASEPVVGLAPKGEKKVM